MTLINKKIMLVFLLFFVIFFSSCGLIRTEGEFLVITSSPNPVTHTLVTVEDTTEYRWDWYTTFTNTGQVPIIINGATLTITSAQGTASQEIYVGPIKISNGTPVTLSFAMQSSSIAWATLTYLFKGNYFEGASLTKSAGISLN